MVGPFVYLALIAVGFPAGRSAPAAGGEIVYFADVFPRGTLSEAPMFIDERLVEEHAGVLVSTHVTRDRAGATVIRESATHSGDYDLIEYTLYANQFGQAGTIRVQGDRVSYERLEGTERQTRAEHVNGPVVVGPTLVGYIVRHLDLLQAGEELEVRLAVLDRLETYGFKLKAVEAGPGQTRIRMKPSSFLIAMAVDPLYFTFETATRKPIRLEGRVSPEVRDEDGWHAVDARVEYRLVLGAYR
jgi:hypothetical protein